MKTMIFNSVTSGFWRYDLDPSDKRQPLLIGVAAVLEDDEQKELDRFVGLVKLPSGYTVNDKAAEFHGITKAKLGEFGAPLCDVVQSWLALADVADRIVAYSHDFHRDVMLAAMRKCHTGLDRDDMPEQYCAMRQAVEICKIPNPKGKGHKWPKLIEAYEFFNKVPLAIDTDQGPLDILDQHLAAVRLIYHGILAEEALVKRETESIP